MERHYGKRLIAANLLALPALVGCTIDSYHTDPSDVQCNDGRTKTELSGDGSTKFIVHGPDGVDPAAVTVRRDNNLVSLKTEGNVTGPPQVLEKDGYTTPVPTTNGTELSSFGAEAAWIIDVDDKNVIIQGTCEGM